MFILCLLILFNLTFSTATNEWFSQEEELNASSNSEQCDCENKQLLSNVTNYFTHNSSSWSCIYAVETRNYRCKANKSNTCIHPKVTKRFYLPQKRCAQQFHNNSKQWTDKTNPCSKTCGGGGVRTNYRVCYTHKNTTKSKSPAYYCKARNVPCNVEPCKASVPANVYKWTWILSPCSVTCYNGQNPGHVVAKRQCVKATDEQGDKKEVFQHNMCTSKMDNKSFILNCSYLLPCLNPTSSSSQNLTESTRSSKNQKRATTPEVKAKTTLIQNTKDFQSTQTFFTTSSSSKPYERTSNISLMHYGFVLVCCLATVAISMVCAGLVSYFCFGCLERRKRKLKIRNRSLEISSPIPSTLTIGRHSTHALQVLNNTIPINQNTSITMPQTTTATSFKSTQRSLVKTSSKRQNGGAGVATIVKLNDKCSQNLYGVYDVCCAMNPGQNKTGRIFSSNSLPRQIDRGSVSSTVYLTPTDAATENPLVGAQEKGNGICPPSYSDEQSIVNLGPPPPIPVKQTDGPSARQSPKVDNSGGRAGYKDIMEDLTKVLSELQGGAEKNQTSQLPQGINQRLQDTNELHHIYDEVFDSCEPKRGQAQEINDYPGGSLGQPGPRDAASSETCRCNGMHTIYATVQRK